MKLTLITVSLKDNINTLKKSIYFFDKNYLLIHTYIIVPEIDFGEFIREFSQLLNEKKITIINENEILNFTEFLKIYESINLQNVKFENPKWYYQQFLKILFTLYGNIIHEKFEYPVVMFDADSYPLKKIKFFDKEDNIILYGSLLEKHNDYIKILEYIYNKQINYRSGYTVQFFSCTKLLRDFIISRFFTNNSNNVNLNECTKVLLEYLYNCFNEINGQKLSEQEFFGVAEMIFNKNIKQRPLLSFRPWNLDSYLTKYQEYILLMCGFSLITYEKQASLTKTKYLNNKKFIKLLLSSLIFQLKNYYKFYIKWIF